MLPVFGLVGGEDVIEGAVFADDHDDMLDGGCSLGVVAVGLRESGRGKSRKHLQPGQNGRAAPEKHRGEVILVHLTLQQGRI